MKRQFLISLFVLFFVSGFTAAMDLQWSGVPSSQYDSSTPYKQNELIVRFADPETGTQLPEGPVLMGPLTRRAIRSRISDFIVVGAEVETEYDTLAPGLAIVKLPEGTDVLDAGIKFLESSNIIYAEPNYKYRMFAVPGDPFFTDQWGLDNTGQTGGTEDADIDAPEAWDITTGSSDIVVAVIDSGIDYMHPDLAANMWINTAEQAGTPGVDDDNNGYIDDIYGYDFAGASAARSGDGDSDPKDSWFHGTHVAGIIGAVGNNGQGVAGVCWNVKLMALKIYSDDFNVVPETFASDAILAIQYAINNGADIINFSSGGQYNSQALKDAIEEAGDAGILFVAGAGNDYGSDNDETPVYPASYDLDNIISVMSTDPNDMMSDFSNFGATSVDIAAPGTEIVSTTPTVGNMSMTVFGVSTNYDTISTTSNGTSQATGYISGAAALVWSHYPALPKEVIKGLLMKTVDPVLTTPRRCLSGGRVNLYNALTLIPPGKPGRVINAKDPNHLYNTIQAAIDEAQGGDELIAEAGTLFFEGIDFDGKAITLRSGDINEPTDANISPENTVILGMLSDGSTVTFANNEKPNTILKGLTISRGDTDYGGGITCKGASPTITDCIISNNIAKYYGAGIDCTNGSSPIIKNCTITGNQTSGSAAIGGGINIEDSSPKIESCTISYNFADNIGGGIACYNSNPTIFNCLVANNEAVYEGGGIDIENSSPVVTNCTIIVDDPNAPKDGGIFASEDSSPAITNCILWGNGDDLFNCAATYSCIEDDDQGIGNIHIEPTFVTGPLGNYYLSQTAAGQLTDSSGIDLGNPDTDPGLQINTYTTRTDGQTDAAVADMGFHYPALPAKMLQLNITVAGEGTVEPGSGTYRQYEVVQLKADPNEGYRIKSWTGTEDDSSLESEKAITMIADTNISIEFELIPLHQLVTKVDGGHGRISPDHRRGQYYPEGTVVTLIATPETTYDIDKWTGTDDDTSWSTQNTVTIDSDKEVIVTFRQPKSLHVPGQYPTIGDAINAAYDHGDKVIVSAGTYPGGYDFQGKAITVASEHPDDPASVAATIIDCASVSNAFIFQSGEGRDSVLDGFTITNGSPVVDPNTPPDTGGTGGNGANAFGGAITCMNGASPTLSNLIISNSTAYGQNGEDSSFIFPAYPAPPDPPDPLEPNAPYPDLPTIDPNDPFSYDPNNVASWDPNDPWDSSMPWDPNNPQTPASDTSIDGMDGQNGADGLDGEPGADGMDGADGYKGGDGGLGYGGAMYFDANCAPLILHCTITDCNAIGGNGGYGGRGQDGQDGQSGQDGQPGQDGQAGQEGYNDGATGAGGNGGNGGAGGAGGKGGNGGKGGDGGAGAEALGGAIYFGPDCRPTIRYCTILNCYTRQGIGSRGGIGGIGGVGGATGGTGAAGGAGGDGDPAGADGTENTETAPGGDGGTGGDGGNASADGARTWGGAVYFGENCEVDISDSIIANNTTTTITRSDPFDPNAGGDPNAFEPGTGGAAGTDGADGQPGAAGSSADPSVVTTFGGGNYYESGVKVKMTNCMISYNNSEQHDGGGEFYSEGSTVVFDQSQFTGNSARYGAGQFYDPNCKIEIKGCEYTGNSALFDGGGLFITSESSLDIDDSKFISNIVNGSGGGLYGGGEFIDPNLDDDIDELVWHNSSTIKIEDTEFFRNLALFGGGMYWHGDDSEVSIAYCQFDDNTADGVNASGGGLYFSRGAPKITGCTIINNDANDTTPGVDSYSGGGGIFCWSSDAKIEDCILQNNSASGSGGAVYLGGDPSAPVLRNCLIQENLAVIDGGGIVANWYVEPTIINSTITNNIAYDPNDANRGRGGGLSCTYQSNTTLINSILWDNSGTIGNQIAIGSKTDPVYLDRPATLTVSYSDIQGGRTARAVHVEPGRTLNWLSGNIDTDPLFAQQNFLSQTQAGQAADSPCIDSGSDSVSNLGFDLYTTRTDHLADAGVVDMGYHHIIRGPEQELTLVVIGPGAVQVDPDIIDPNRTVNDPENQTHTYTLDTYRGSVIRFTATPDEGYRVRSWTGTDKDPSWNTNANKLTVNGTHTIRVEFEQDIIRLVKVPADYRTIEEAVRASDNGTKIMVDRGIHYISATEGIDFQGKAITLMSVDPNNPEIIANTIIDCNGARLSNCRAFYFHSGEGNNTKILGLTIRNGYINGGNGTFGRYGILTPDPYDYFYVPAADQDPNQTPPRAEAGKDVTGNGFGGGILCENGSSPTIKNCIITNCTVTGAHGGDGADGMYPYETGMNRDDLPDEWSYWAPTDDDPTNIQTSSDGQFGGHGGTGSGNGNGGAIACLSGSCPIIINCKISDNFAYGGMGGDGGNGGTTSGGNESGGGTGGDAIGAGKGGGIYSDGQSHPIVTDCSFANNIAATGIPGTGGDVGTGGALDPRATAGLSGMEDPNNGIIAGGAAYFGDIADANIVNCKFSDNSAYVLNSNFGLSDPTYTYTIGGALYSSINNAVILNNCTFTNNLGGAVYCRPGCVLDVNDCSFSDNTEAVDGAAIYIPERTLANIKNSKFSGNSASRDGGAVYSDSNADFTNCNFNSNTAAENGGAFEGYFDANNPEIRVVLKFNFDQCNFVGNQASAGFYGWGGAVHLQDFDAVFNDCYFVNNSAKSGGGLFLSKGTVAIDGGIIKGNKSIGGTGTVTTNQEQLLSDALANQIASEDFVASYFNTTGTANLSTSNGIGGGLVCADTKATIENCILSDNVAGSNNGSGGAISFYGGLVEHSVKNCLFTNNSATLDGGAISNKLFAKPEIKNCTFAANTTIGRGGAIFSDWLSNASIVDSIFQSNNNGAVTDEGVSNTTVRYSVFSRNQEGDYRFYDKENQQLNTLAGIELDSTNIQADPMFVTGPLGGYYLSQITEDSPQAQKSPAVDAGSALAADLGFSDLTTRNDGIGDSDQVDIGYHHPNPNGLPMYTLTVRVLNGQGGTIAVEPVRNSYYAGSIVKLTASPDANWQLSKWLGTDNDSSKTLTNTVTIIGADALIEVEFLQPAVINVPGDYQTIQDAVTAANDGDKIIVDRGVYYGGYLSYALLIDKSVYITSKDPHDPNTVASTIISGNRGVSNWNYIGIVFRFTTDANTVLNGFTIENFGGNWGDGDDGDRNEGHPNGYDGAPAEGAGIYIEPGASPTIKNCIIRNNIMNAGSGGNGVGADQDYNAGRGGWGGWAHGAGIYCGPYTNPTIINCTIEGNIAQGGNGGNGGNEAANGGYANYGGNYSREGTELNPVYNFDPDTITLETIVGHLWENWDWDFATEYGPIYGQPDLTSYINDYRWYSAYGGGIFCDFQSNVTFEHCEIRGNRTHGGMSGQGGTLVTGRFLEPLVPYELPSFGAGVYCAADTSVTFNGCTFEDNVASETLVDPNHRLSPYIGYGGGVSAENSALLYFADCNFVDNGADSGGAIHTNSTDVKIVDCNIVFNRSLRGGGFLGDGGALDIRDTIIAYNQAMDDVNDPNDNVALSEGAGLCVLSADSVIQDCNISYNNAGASGGGIYLRGANNSNIRNNLITNNSAGRDGGGISTNWFNLTTIANCTFSGNAVLGTVGEPNNTGLGGALYCGYQSEATATDSIFWNNFGLRGQEIAVGSGFELDPLCGKANVLYSDVKSSPYNVWADEGCELSLEPDDGNISQDPLFVEGPDGRYYLSHAGLSFEGTGQSSTSPCVDSGSDYASHVGLLGYTTRTDFIRDKGKVDMGYHYKIGGVCGLADFVDDGIVNLMDLHTFIQLAEKWLDVPCSEENDWCDGADIRTDGTIDDYDLHFVEVDCNGVADINAPEPDPSEWDTEPYMSSLSSITMVAETAFDAWSRDVEYYFECVTTGGHDSGWQDSPVYTDAGLNVNQGYGYRVRARDKFGNMTGWSEIRYAGIDTIPPAPAPYIERVDVNSPTSMTMVATITYDLSDVEYYFQNTVGDVNDSGWQEDPNYTVVNLDPNTQYGYRVKARDKSARQNETEWSDTVLFMLPVSQDQDPPLPDPMEWDPTLDPNGFDGTPRELLVDANDLNFGYGVTMTAVVAVDAGGGPVEYYFECTTEHGFDSGWIQTPTYTILVGRSGQGHRFRVRARDQYGNMTAWSPEERAD
jgi:hypothetical protein